MKIVLLGTGGYHPSTLRHTACMMLPSEGIVLDAGTAMFRVRDWIETDTIDILLSHAHLDHVIGLTFMFDVLYKKKVTCVTAYAEAAKIAAIKEHLFANDLFPAVPPITFVPIDAQSPNIANNCNITHFPLQHPGGALGFRLDWPDRSLAYVTDTVADIEADYLEHIAGVDLLIHECYFDDNESEYAMKTGHSWGSAVASVAQKANVGRLALVHVNPVLNEADPIGLDAVREIFPNTILGTDNMELEF